VAREAPPPPGGANSEALSTLSTLDGQNMGESALHSWKDISTSNIDDALQSLHNNPSHQSVGFVLGIFGRYARFGALDRPSSIAAGYVVPQ
jgi:hypothetical protein